MDNKEQSKKIIEKIINCHSRSMSFFVISITFFMVASFFSLLNVFKDNIKLAIIIGSILILLSIASLIIGLVYKKQEKTYKKELEELLGNVNKDE